MMMNRDKILFQLFCMIIFGALPSLIYGQYVAEEGAKSFDSRFADTEVERLFLKGDFDDAYNYCTDRLKMCNDSEIIAYIRTAAYLKSRLGGYDEAITLINQALEIEEKNDAIDLEYCDALNDLATYYSRLSKYSTAIDICDNALKLYDELGYENYSYISLINNLSHYKYKSGALGEAIELSKRAKELIECYDSNSELKINILQNMAHYQSRSGEYSDAVRLCEEADSLLKKRWGENHPDRPNLLSDISTYYSRMGDYLQARNYEEQALKFRGDVLGKGHPDYAMSLNRLAHYNYKMGGVKKAIALSSEAHKIHQCVLPPSHLDYIVNLNDLSKYYASIDSIDQALNISLSIKNTYEENYSCVSVDYANLLSNIASYYNLSGDYENAFAYEREVLKIRSEIFSPTHPDCAKSLFRLAVYSSQNKDISSLSLAEDALKIQLEKLGEHHPDVLNTYRLLADLSHMFMCNSEAERYAQLATTLSIERLKKSFQGLIDDERKTLWAQDNMWFSTTLPQLVLSCNSDRMNAIGLEGILFSKGVLQNSVVELGKFIGDYGSQEQEKMFNLLQTLRRDLNKQYELPIDDRTLDIDLLEDQISEIERELILTCEEFGDYTRNLSISWTKVRDCLKPNEVAIEFQRVPLSNDSAYYVAYVLKNDMSAPDVIKLFEENLLGDIVKNLSRQTKRSVKNVLSNVGFTELIWGKLKSYLLNSDNVYFAADGKLHFIGIEYFLDFDGEKLLSDRIAFHRLSSTRQIAMSTVPHGYNNCMLYGGILYDFDADGLNCFDLDSNNTSLLGTNGIDADTLIRSSADFLQNTEIEVKTIEDILTNNHVSTCILSGLEATEESVKSISGNSPDLLHIATHGYFWDREQAEREAQLNKNLVFLSQYGDNAPINFDDRAMVRSALALAKANLTFRGIPIPDGDDDGILTAREISQLDLRKSDLVVLSACQTGMGDIGYDGVYGLQRGFKMAGVNSLLISLWKVSDEATQLLMTEFYRGLMDGKSKQRSLTEAQAYVRSLTRFSNPYFWAGFVLLDALN